MLGGPSIAQNTENGVLHGFFLTWKAEESKLIPVMTDKSSAPNALIQMIH